MPENDKITCSICDTNYKTFKFTESIRYHIIRAHEEDYKNTTKKRNWIWQFYNIEGNNLNCKLCGQDYRIATNNTTKIIKHLTNQHKVNKSKAICLRNWIESNLNNNFKVFIGNKTRCKKCGCIYQRSNSFVLMEHLKTHNHKIPLEIIPKQ